MKLIKTFSDLSTHVCLLKKPGKSLKFLMKVLIELKCIDLNSSLPGLNLCRWKKMRKLLILSPMYETLLMSRLELEKRCQKKLGRKIMRSLSKRFDMKVTVVEEPQDILEMKVDEILGFLMKFELGLENRPEKKAKSFFLKSPTKEVQIPSEDEFEEDMHECLALLTKLFNRIVKRFDKRPKGNLLQIS